MTRSLSADLIKAISIFGVVFIHSAGNFGSTSDFQVYTANTFRFCVPVFILLWAFFLEKSYRRSTDRTRYILSRLRHLAIVFLVWSTVYFLITVDWKTFRLPDLITSHYSGYGWPGQYFFIILFQLLVLYPLLRMIYLNKAARYFTLAVIVILYVIRGYYFDSLPGIISALGDRPFVFWIPYVFLGIALTDVTIRKINPMFALILLLIPAESYFAGFERSAYISPAVLIASIIFFLTVFSQTLRNSTRLTQTGSFLGKNTMIVFVANPLVIMLLTRIFPNAAFSGVIAELTPFLFTAVVIIICLTLQWILRKLKMEHYFS